MARGVGNGSPVRDCGKRALAASAYSKECRRPDSNRHGVVPGDFESYPPRVDKRLNDRSLHQTPLATGGFQPTIRFILFLSGLVLLAGLDLVGPPDGHQNHSDSRDRLAAPVSLVSPNTVG